MKILEIEQNLKEVNYIPNKSILYAVSGTINENTPLLIEGDPGVGKTMLAKAIADMLNLPLYRVQFYEGLTADKILYDYNYQKQLLTIESIKSTLESNLRDKSISEAMDIVKDIDFYGGEFLIERPILKSISGKQRCVLLLDEIDKSSEEIEYTLLEMLDEFSLSIPQYGTVKCPEDMRPLVFLTSNNYRELSDALKRRCNYLYINSKSKDEIFEILKMKTNVSEKICRGVANCLSRIQDLPLKQTPSIAEAIEWSKYIENNLRNNMDDIDYTICMLAKNKDDILKIKNSGIVRDEFKE